MSDEDRPRPVAAPRRLVRPGEIAGRTSVPAAPGAGPSQGPEAGDAARAVPRPVAGGGRTLVAPGAIRASLKTPAQADTPPPGEAPAAAAPDDAGKAKKRAAFDRGLSAESRAAALLLQKGFGIIGRRVRTPAGELDVIARRGDLVVFCEVKARGSLDSAAESVTPRQQARLVAAAEAWLAVNPRHQGTAVRFDVVLVAPGFAPKHLAGAFDASV